MNEGSDHRSNELGQPIAIDIKRTGYMLSLGRTKIFELLATGQLTKVKIGRRTLVTSESIDALIERLAGH